MCHYSQKSDNFKERDKFQLTHELPKLKEKTCKTQLQFWYGGTVPPEIVSLRSPSSGDPFTALQQQSPPTHPPPPHPPPHWHSHNKEQEA